MVIKRIPVKPPKKRTGGGVTDVSAGKGWHRESARHSAAAKKGISKTRPSKLTENEEKSIPQLVKVLRGFDPSVTRQEAAWWLEQVSIAPHELDSTFYLENAVKYIHARREAGR